jgi:hypothetical protein
LTPDRYSKHCGTMYATSGGISDLAPAEHCPRHAHPGLSLTRGVCAMTINRGLVAGSSTPLVLAILAERDSYGYGILKRVRVSGSEGEWTDGMLDRCFTGWSAPG